MRLRKMAVMILAAVGLTLSLGLSQVVSATASTAQTGSSHSETVLIPGANASGSAGKAVPQVTRFRECSNLTTMWVDIDMVTASGVLDWCFGGKSNGMPWRFSAAYPDYISNLCAGNNRGTLSYSLNNVYHQLSFVPGGGTYRLPAGNRPISLTILGFSGNATCYS